MDSPIFLLLAIPIALVAGLFALRHPSLLIALSVYTISLDHMGRLQIGPLTLNNLLKIVLISVALIWMLTSGKRIQFPRPLLWFLPFLIFSGLSVFHSADFPLATFKFFRLFIVWLYALLVANFVERDRDLVYLLVSIIVTTFIVSMLAHMQTLNVLTRGAVELVEKQGPEASGVRAVSTFWDSNRLGQFLAILSIFLVSALTLPTRSKIWKILVLGVLFMAFGAVLLSFSRSAWLGLGLSMLLMLASRQMRPTALAFAAVGVAGILYMAVFTPYGGFLFTRLQTLGNLGGDFSGQFRWLLGVSGLRMWVDGLNWLWGSGYYSFAALVPQYWHPAMSHDMIFHSGTKMSHIFYITVIAEGGMIGVGLFLLFVRSVFKEIRHTMSRKLGSLPRVFLIAVTVLLSVRLVDFLFNPSLHDNLLWLMLGLLGALARFPSLEGKEPISFSPSD
jgi:hypothetical protein